MDFKVSLMSTLGRIRRNRRCVVAGDINIDFNMYGCFASTDDFAEELISLNFISYALSPSRITMNSATAVDHVYTNCHLCLVTLV